MALRVLTIDDARSWASLENKSLIDVANIRLGTSAASTGAVNLSNAEGIAARNFGNTADIELLRLTTGDKLSLWSGEVVVESGLVTVANDVIINGNLTLNGNPLEINAETVTVADNIILLNSNVTGVPSEDSGIEVERGTSTNSRIMWNETADEWQAGLSGSEYTLWTAGNQGAGSGLDADKLDTYHASSFPRKDEAATITANWTFNSDVTARSLRATDDGTGQIILSARADDDNPWVFELGNDTYGGNGLRALQTNAGHMVFRLYGLGTHRDLYFQGHNGTAQEDWLRIGSTVFTYKGTNISLEGHTHALSALTGTVTNAQVPEAAITQHAGALSVTASQVSDFTTAVNTILDATQTISSTWTFSSAAQMDNSVRLQNETGDPFTGVTGYSSLYTNAGGVLKLRDGTGAIYTVSMSGHQHPWAAITSTPTTLTGYGITDAAPLSHATSTANPHNVTKAQVGLASVENTALSTWSGSTAITTLGSITTGTWAASAIGPTRGGTGLSAYTLGDVLYSGATNTLNRLSGNTTTTRKFLRQTGTGTVSAAPAWDTVTKSDVGLSAVENTALSTWVGSTSVTTLGTITEGTWNGTTIGTTRGGTGLTSFSTGDILYASSANTLSKLPAGSNGYVLTVSGGVPAWVAGAASSLAGLSDTGISGLADAQVLQYSTGSGTWVNRTLAAAGISQVGHTHALEDASNLTITAIGAGEIIKWNGSGYVNNTLAEAGISAVGHTHETSDISNLSSWSGSTAITTLGTVVTGTWQGTPVASAYIGAHTQAWSTITATPTTLSGYGITNAIVPGGAGASALVVNHNDASFAGLDINCTTAFRGLYIRNSGLHNNVFGRLNVGTSSALAPSLGIYSEGSVVSNTGFSGSGASLTALNATQLTSGTVPSGRLSGNYSSITGLGTVTSGVWNATAISATRGGTAQTSWTLGDILYASAANTLSRLAGNSTSTKKFLRQTGTGTVSAAPAWDTVTKADVGLSVVENTALSTWAGTTNVTTLGTVTAGTWSGTTIAVNKGGTGATTLTGLLVGNGTSPVTAVSLGANQLVRRNATNTAYEAVDSSTLTGVSETQAILWALIL